MNIFSVLLLTNSCITGFLTFYALHAKRTSINVSFAMLMLAVTFYSFGYAFELSGNTYPVMRTWLYIEYIGIPFIPSLWLIFTLTYLGYSKWLKPHFLILYLGISVVTLLLHYTNNLHHLFYQNIQVDNNGHFPVLILTKGIWYWVHMAYFNLVVLISTILFLNKFYRSPALYKKQYALMLAGTIVPWIVNTIYITGYGPRGIDLNPFSAMITGSLFGWGIFSFQLMDVVPVALENVFESMRDGVIVLDQQRRILNFNPAASKNLGCLTKYSIGMPLVSELSHFTELHEILANEKSESAEFSVTFKDPPGSFLFSLSPVSKQKKTSLGYILIIKDITEHKLTEETLKKNELDLRELNATKDKLISIMAHDLRNPFNMITSLVTMVADDAARPSEKELNDFMGYLQEAAINANSILENMLLWTRAQTGKLEFAPALFNLMDLVNESINNINSLAHGKNISLLNEVPESSAIWADRNMLGTIVRNLLSNAVKFTRENGFVKCNFDETENDYRIKISDTGTGMNQKEINALFSLQMNASKIGTKGEKGTGFGLLICHEFVSIHGGAIQVESVPELGSTFTINLPKKSRI